MALVLTIPMIGLPACEKVTAEKIETWKGTVKGPGKLQDAFTSSNVDPDLRAQAALALYSLGQGEVVHEKLAQMPPEARGPVVSALIRRHMQSLASDTSTASVQAARDGLFAVRSYASAEELPALDEALLKAIRAQATAQGSISGSQSLSMIVEALGAKSAPLLVDLMGRPEAPHADLAELLLKVGDEKANAEASAKLAALARKKLQAQQAVDGGTWRALGLLGGAEAVAFLQEHVDKGPWQSAEQAARALQLRPQPGLGDFALERATNAKLHGNVREEMFGLAESCCGKDVLPGLLRILSGSGDMLVRYRAYEAALHVGGVDAVDPALDAFPAQAAFKPEDVQDFLVKDTLAADGQTGKGGQDVEGGGAGKVREQAAQLLTAASPLKRMVGVLVLEKVGTAEDGKALQKLAADKGVVKGFPSGQTVGKEAARVASLLAKGA